MSAIGGRRTSRKPPRMSAYDPKRTSALILQLAATVPTCICQTGAERRGLSADCCTALQPLLIITVRVEVSNYRTDLPSVLRT